MSENTEAPQVSIDYSGVSASWAFIPMLYSGEDREQAMRLASLMFLTTEASLAPNWREQAGHVLAFLKGNVYPERATPDNVIPFGRRPSVYVIPNAPAYSDDPNPPQPA